MELGGAVRVGATRSWWEYVVGVGVELVQLVGVGGTMAIEAAFHPIAPVCQPASLASSFLHCFWKRRKTSEVSEKRKVSFRQKNSKLPRKEK